ncbi:MAG TPA: glycosyltransferase [Bacteroidia bacterium]|nr:glycosyltransferase [Bacteroidia bacterium]
MSTIEQFHSKSNKYRVLLLADINSSHIQKWALSLAENGIEIGLFSFSKLKQDWIRGKENIHILFTPDEQDVPKILSKAIYPFLLPDLKRAIKEFKPDILHAHYASSYGLIGALAGFHPFIISVWGSDVFNFPKISPMHKRLLKFNLRKADKICSTSHIMKEETKKYTNKEISVIPFGIDLNIYKPFHAHHVFNDDAIVIGTVKALEEKYGIAYLIDAFALLRKRVKSYPLKLLIVGKGSLDIDLKRKVKDFGIESDVVFTGYIPPAEIPFYQNMLTIAVFPSIDKSESFGVSAVEAMACEKPVVVSNIGGLPEVVEAGVTGLIVPPANAEKLAETLEILVKDEQLRDKLGKLGRSRVAKLYNWENNLADMIRIYKALIAEKSK